MRIRFRFEFYLVWRRSIWTVFGPGGTQPWWASLMTYCQSHIFESKWLLRKKKKRLKKVKITLFKVVDPLEMKVRQMTNCIFFRHFIKNISRVSLFDHENLDSGSAHRSARRRCLGTHQTFVFSSSVTALRVSGKRGWRRKSPSSSTQRTRSPPSPNCPSLSPSSTTAPWTSRRRRSLTSLRRWWWVLHVLHTLPPIQAHGSVRFCSRLIQTQRNIAVEAFLH